MLAEMFDGNDQLLRLEDDWLTMLENREILPDPDDSYFIDRDGTYFRLILNYLRDSRVSGKILEAVTHELCVDTVGRCGRPQSVCLISAELRINMVIYDSMDELMQEARFYKLKGIYNLTFEIR